MPLVLSAGRVLRMAFEERSPSPFVDEKKLPFEEGPGAFALERAGQTFAVAKEGVPLLEGRADATQGALTLDVPRAVGLYGFGAATGRPDREGQRFRLLCLDTLFYGIRGSSYTSFPFFVARLPRGALGVLLNTTLPVCVETRVRSVCIKLERGDEAEPLDLVLFTGSFAEILDDYTALTGRPFLPPLWSLGYHQSRWSYRTEARVEALAQRFREEEVPCDAIHLDIHYMHEYRVFTWDRGRFPDPKGMHARLAELDFSTVAIVDPGVSKAAGYSVYEEGARRGVFLRRSDGSEYVGKGWPGETVFPDFTKPEARTFWAEQHEALFDVGVRGIWNDMNDPVLRVGRVYEPLEEDIQHEAGSHRRLRNLYANLEADATLEAFERYRPDERPFVLTRSGTVGIQARAAVWTGDNHSSWDQLRENLWMVLNLGLCGVPFSGADIGGFGGRRGRLGVFKLRVSGELFARWMELGAWMPLCRAHTVLYSPDQEPWSFGPEVLDVSRKVLRRRYRLLPYLYARMHEATRTGLPLVRPLFLHHADAPRAASEDQFLVGEDVLVAPVLEPGVSARDVWLPEGEWLCFETGERFLGPSVVTRPAPLGSPPVFVRAGAAIPSADVARPKSTADVLKAPLCLELFPTAGEGGIRGDLVVDDGTSRAAVSAGAYLHIEVEGAHDAEGRLRLRLRRAHDGFAPARRELWLRVPRAFAAAQIGDKVQPAALLSLEREDRQMEVATFRAPLAEGEVVLFLRP